MTFLDWLRKLGIVRFGTKSAKYTSYKDMPDELMFDDVYNTKKDLTTKEDSDLINKTAGSCIYWVLILAILFLLLIILSALEFANPYFWIITALWIIYLWRLKRAMAKSCSVVWWGILLVIWVTVTLYLMIPAMKIGL